MDRIETDRPKETWQSDFPPLALVDAADTKIPNFLGDRYPYLLACTTFRPVTTVVATAAD
ncbi:hypothetical protein GCM10009712_37730 [Pseudarthrobacter sulfonivorans]|uniref:hypothetical protein n=1 Tax=Pseudarthrobacter sulfonivorans TaxID=121292 RepID=UPI001CC29041|nr:hypothetical protein [Pseudarthrobacter sulfonivorans]